LREPVCPIAADVPTISSSFTESVVPSASS
jgi:hypothetical protein